MYPLYIKKEDARHIANWQRKATAFVLIGVAVVMGIMQWIASPKLLSMYADLKLNPPLTLSLFQPMPIVAVISLIVALGLLFSHPNYKKIDDITSKYKDGEMIRSNEVLNNQYIWLVLGVMVLVVVYLALTIILPIFNLTNSV